MNKTAQVSTFSPPPPEGYRPRESASAYSQGVGPFYIKFEHDQLWQGLWIEARHTNSMGVVHGGMIMTLADNVMAGAAYTETKSRCVTLQMDLQFIAAARKGDWLEGRGKVLRATQSLVFCEGEILVASRLIAKSSGVFKRKE